MVAMLSCRKKQVSSLTDLSEVIDFNVVLESFRLNGVTPPGISRFDCPGFHRPVFCFDDRPGIVLCWF